MLNTTINKNRKIIVPKTQNFYNNKKTISKIFHFSFPFFSNNQSDAGYELESKTYTSPANVARAPFFFHTVYIEGFNW